ncbi:hypothetical protein [uncultured Salegentibacter sp.]|uniref:RHS repeat domain-containing protein n=1 Tax=uncultured Salegentibacter sp. TaxID=259320 RepID=UPI0030DCC88B
MNQPEVFSGEFKEVKIENSGAEVIRKNGDFEVVESDVRTDFFLHPKFKNIKFKNGKRIFEEEKSFFSDHISRKYFRYNEKNQLSEIELEDYKTYKFTYNQSGQLSTKTRDQGASGSYDNRYYYSHGLLTKVEWRSYSYAEIDWTFEYDSKGNNLQKIGHYLRGQVAIAYESSHEYDNNNRLIKSHEERNKDYRENEIKEINFEYDENDRLTKKTIRESGTATDGFFKETFKYNSHGNIISYVKTRNGDMLENKSYEYEYDLNRNWVRSIEFEDFKPVRITKRTFLK